MRIGFSGLSRVGPRQLLDLITLGGSKGDSKSLAKWEFRILTRNLSN